MLRCVPDEAEPPRKVYGFKDREFHRDNTPPTASRPPPPTVQELARMAGPVTRSTPRPTTAPKAGDPNDVYAILQQNRQAEQHRGADQLELKPVKSRRARDYWLLLILAEAGLGLTAYLGRGNPFVLTGAVAAMGFVALGLTWIMWQVMGRY